MSVLNSNTPSVTVGFYMFANNIRVWDIVVNSTNKKQTITVASDVNGTSLQIYVASAGTIDFTLSPVLSTDSYADSYAPYSNICPISGRTGCNISHSGEDTSDPTVIPISWHSEAGTVYGGTLDVTSGVLTVDRASESYNSSSGFANHTSNRWYHNGLPNGASNVLAIRRKAIANIAKCVPDSVQTYAPYFDFGSSGFYLNKLAANETLEELNTRLQTTPLVFCYYLATPQTYQLTPTEVTTLLGQNNIWADTGDVTVTAPKDTKLYIDGKLAEIQATILENIGG